MSTQQNQARKGGFGDSYRLQQARSVGFSPEVRGLEYAFKGYRSLTASAGQGVRVEESKIQNSRKTFQCHSTSPSLHDIQLHLGTHVACSVVGLRSCSA